MGWVDLVPRAGGSLYIGGLYALYQTDLIRAAGITHVLSVIDYDPLLHEKFGHLKHYHIRADDDPNEDLLRYFESTTKYIDEGLNSEVFNEEGSKKKGGVFVHCAMGKSRSATLIIAYLMWKFKIGWKEALEQVCEGRPVCDPNVGFKEQLAVWASMLECSEEQERWRVYEKWKGERFQGTSWEWETRQRERDSLRQSESIKAKI
ncbi:phosphatases II [Periconia macrospinosa]|uniref:Phosphatases II n=1 Tax=Periconia macrospinosa TaxID=97972 RepID=A0A2V1D504_9PLEO|nr:phosphatases II [Periconia macrospinosa]